MRTHTVVFAVSALVSVASSAQAGEYFTHRFGSDRLNPRILAHHGRHASDAITEGRNGMVIKLPVDEPRAATQAGVETKFLVEGDFEITVGYELVEVEQPDKGYGAGVVVRLPKAVEAQEHAGFARRKQRDGKGVFTTLVRSHVRGQEQDERGVFDSETDRGQLRLVRSGTMLHFLVADEESDEFRELCQVEFGAEPLRAVQVLGDTGGSKQPLTVRLTHLSVRSQMLSYGMPAGRQRFVWSTWGILGTVGIVVLVGCGVWYWRREY